MKAIQISSVSIRQDKGGRYSLNDLHKAAGGEKRHSPSYWLENQQTIDLISLLKSENCSQVTTGIPVVEQNQPVTVINGGKAPGTYVVKELVYAYAMWISAQFHLQVIRAYDAMVTAPKLTEKKTKQAFNGCLTLDQQDAIKTLVLGRVNALPHDKQKGAAIRIWSAIKAKYGITYKQIKTEEFQAVCSLVARLPLEGELLPKPEATPPAITISIEPSSAKKRWIVEQPQSGMLIAYEIGNDDIVGNEEKAVRELRHRGYSVLSKQKAEEIAAVLIA